MAIILPPNSTGTELETMTVSSKDRQVMALAGATTTPTQVASVISAAPVASAPALVVRNIPSGTQSIDDAAGSITVDAPVGTPVFARLSDGTTALTTASGRLSVDASGVAVPITDNSASITVDGTVTAANAAGDVAHDAVDSGNPLKIGGIARTAEAAAVSANNDRVNAVFDTVGRQLMFPYCHPADILTPGNSAALAATAPVGLIAAQGAGVRTYVTSISVVNSHASANTIVQILEGTNVLWTIPAQSGGGGEALSFPTPLRGGANATIGAQCLTTGASVYVSVAGFKSAV